MVGGGMARVEGRTTSSPKRGICSRASSSDGPVDRRQQSDVVDAQLRVQVLQALEALLGVPITMWGAVLSGVMSSGDA